MGIIPKRIKKALPDLVVSINILSFICRIRGKHSWILQGKDVNKRVCKVCGKEEEIKLKQF